MQFSFSHFTSKLTYEHISFSSCHVQALPVWWVWGIHSRVSANWQKCPGSPRRVQWKHISLFLRAWVEPRGSNSVPITKSLGRAHWEHLWPSFLEAWVCSVWALLVVITGSSLTQQFSSTFYHMKNLQQKISVELPPEEKAQKYNSELFTTALLDSDASVS